MDKMARFAGYWSFTGKEACLKCGFPFHPDHGRQPDVQYVRGAYTNPKDHLECECPRCGYTWDEPPLDATDG